jgi:MATE family multidrug resistance protein
MPGPPSGAPRGHERLRRPRPAASTRAASRAWTCAPSSRSRCRCSVKLRRCQAVLNLTDTWFVGRISATRWPRWARPTGWCWAAAAAWAAWAWWCRASRRRPGRRPLRAGEPRGRQGVWCALLATPLFVALAFADRLLIPPMRLDPRSPRWRPTTGFPRCWAGRWRWRCGRCCPSSWASGRVGLALAVNVAVALVNAAANAVFVFGLGMGRGRGGLGDRPVVAVGVACALSLFRAQSVRRRVPVAPHLAPAPAHDAGAGLGGAGGGRRDRVRPAGPVAVPGDDDPAGRGRGRRHADRDDADLDRLHARGRVGHGGHDARRAGDRRGRPGVGAAPGQRRDPARDGLHGRHRRGAGAGRAVARAAVRRRGDPQAARVAALGATLLWFAAATKPSTGSTSAAASRCGRPATRGCRRCCWPACRWACSCRWRTRWPSRRGRAGSGGCRRWGSRATGGWTAAVAYVGLLGSALFLRWRAGAWQRIRLG